MKRLVRSTLLLGLCLSFNALAENIDVIYGDDDREDVFASTSSLHVELSKSTAAMMPHSAISVNARGEVKITAGSLASRGICKSERFSNQPSAAYCSGFLVAPNKLVTAGHCIENANDCSSYSWVFNYKMENDTELNKDIRSSDVFKCKRIISRALNRGNSNDYALIELDRVATDITPLKVRTTGSVSVNDNLVVIGHPSGIPTKISAGAKVYQVNSSVYFTANLDTYGGNSGSAVFNADTGVVEGILVRGKTDYVWDSGKQCRVSNLLSDSAAGEEVTAITEVKGI